MVAEKKDSLFYLWLDLMTPAWVDQIQRLKEEGWLNEAQKGE